MEVTKKDVEKLIEFRKENTFLSHLWNVLSRDFRSKGVISRNEIKVWRQNMWNMTFYPIFIFEFNANNHLINITDKINPIGKTFVGIILLGFLYLIFPNNISDFDFIGNWRIIAVITFFAVAVILLARIIYRLEKKNQLELIYEILDIEIEKKKPEKEWSLKKILTRILMYPFCIGLIILGVFYLIPDGEILLAIGIFAIPGMYLYSDVKILLRK